MTDGAPIDCTDLPCGILIVHGSGKIADTNETLAGWVGQQRGRLIGQPLSKVLTISSQMFCQTHLFPMLANEGRFDEIYLKLSRRGDDPIPVLVNGTVDPSRPGRRILAMMIMNRRNEYEQALLEARRKYEAADQAKSRFISVLSHELRTPLQSIAMQHDLLNESSLGPLTDRQRTAVKRLGVASETITSLIEEILDFANSSHGKIDCQMESVSVPAAIERLGTLVSTRIEQSGLAWNVDLAYVGHVHADRRRLQQILLNLVTNAIKFTPAGGTISVKSASDAHGQVALCVEDTGNGIPSDKIHKIFEAFYQVDRLQIAPELRGTGLGLAISRDYAKAMNGELTATSVVGEGSIFTLTLCPR